ncbi:MAG: TonB-dependent receptor [Proteobacteria bacterium]|nr:TonB-dependent receptor [Pseudomonadota bacterium]
MNHRTIPHRRQLALGTAIRAALIATALPVALLVADPSAAQQPTPASTEAPSNTSQAKTLSTITVTAEKRPESEQNVPISMTVVEASRMLDTGKSSLDDYYATVPGLSVNERGAGRTTLIIRGISAGTEQNPTVGVMVDGAPYGSSTTDYSIPDLDPFDIAHIEVLRGPQGTLYGASSMGGMINYVMTDPKTDRFSGHVQAGVSDTAHGGTGFATRAAVNVPVTNSLAIRVSAFKRDDPGYIDDPLQGRKDVNETKVDGERLSALWKINDRFTLHASVLAQNNTADGTAKVDMQKNSYTPVFGSYEHARLPGTDWSQWQIRFYTLQLDGDLGWTNFHAISTYNKFKLNGPQDVTGTFGFLTAPIYGLPGLGVKIDNGTSTGKFSQEFRLASPDDDRALTWLGGVYFTSEHTTGLQDIVAVDKQTGNDLGLGFMYTGRSPSTYKETAAFGTVDYHFTDAFDIQLGGRFSAVRQTFTNEFSGPLNGGDTSDHERASDNVWTYSLSPRYHLNSNVMLYGRVATGYRAGGANTLLIDDAGKFPEQYKSDSLTSYEVGLKGDFANHAITLDTALFHIDWSRIQLADVSQATGDTYTVNASSAKSEGAEATLAWRPMQGLEVRANAAYTRAILTANTPDGTYGLTGDRLPYSPVWSGNLGFDYNCPVSGDWYGNVGASVTYMGNRMSSFTSSAAAQRFQLRSYTTGEIHAGVNSTHWNLQIYVNNLTNARGYLSATPQNATTGVSSTGLFLIRPRTVGVSATYSF